MAFNWEIKSTFDSTRTDRILGELCVDVMVVFVTVAVAFVDLTFSLRKMSPGDNPTVTVRV